MLKQGTVKRSGNITGIAIVQSVVYCVPCGVHALENKLVNRSVYKYNTGERFQVVFLFLEDVSSSLMLKKFYVFRLIQRRLSEKFDLILSVPLNQDRMSSPKKHFFCSSAAYELSAGTTWGNFVSRVKRSDRRGEYRREQK